MKIVKIFGLNPIIPDGRPIPRQQTAATPTAG